ncbi:MAG: hypothetical protein UMR38_01340 [Candidatus Izemoplasma sp.]|nr:hypothetical protein [Candidatus Izemoplasma sp.]
MDKLKLFFRMMFSNKAILKANQFNIVIVFLLLFVNVSLITVPNYYGLADGVRIINRLDGIYETFDTMIDDDLPCEVRNEAMVCDESNLNDYYGDYRLQYRGELDTDNVTESIIYFGEDYLAIIYVDESDTAYILSGDYRLLDEFDFRNVNFADADMSEADYTEYITDVFLQNVYYSNFSQQVYMVYTTQFAQTAIYVIILSIMLMILNYKAAIKKISYLAAIKIVIVAMTGPALLTALLGLFIMGYAGIIFILAYGLRMMFIYYRINNHDSVIY